MTELDQKALEAAMRGWLKGSEMTEFYAPTAPDWNYLDALEADGEKLRQLTGEDHGPWSFEPETFMVPCPVCFESSGYVWEHGNDWESGPWSNQTNIPCRHCEGAGCVPGDDPEPPEYRGIDFEDAGYLAALESVTS